MITHEVPRCSEHNRNRNRTETNREIIRQAFDAWRQGTGASTDVFAPDMGWRIEGHSAASKEYRGIKRQAEAVSQCLRDCGSRSGPRRSSL